MSFFGWLGFIASLLAFLIGFVEPTGTTASQFTYALVLVVGIVVLGIGPFILYAVRKPEWKTVEEEGPVSPAASSVE